jgi:hypothetical protein
VTDPSEQQDDAAGRVAAYLDARAPWAADDGWSFVPDGISYLSEPYNRQLNESDLREVLRQLANAQKRLEWLDALEEAGVDNWGGIEVAQEINRSEA